jgi:hypothetical protein
VGYGHLPLDSPLPAPEVVRTTGVPLLLPTRASGLAYDASMQAVYESMVRLPTVSSTTSYLPAVLERSVTVWSMTSSAPRLVTSAALGVRAHPHFGHPRHLVADGQVLDGRADGRHDAGEGAPEHPPTRPAHPEGQPGRSSEAAREPGTADPCVAGGHRGRTHLHQDVVPARLRS